RFLSEHIQTLSDDDRRALLAQRRQRRAETLASLIDALDPDDRDALAAAVPAITRLVATGTS
ncbi:MAG: hypothetical protein QOF00_1860, partial [Pseudonocardiales bacterium]|nr:hypothetical protein [Pseudonocardiales bacterium]